MWDLVAARQHGWGELRSWGPGLPDVVSDSGPLIPACWAFPVSAWMRHGPCSVNPAGGSTGSGPGDVPVRVYSGPFARQRTHQVARGPPLLPRSVPCCDVAHLGHETRWGSPPSRAGPHPEFQVGLSPCWALRLNVAQGGRGFRRPVPGRFGPGPRDSRSYWEEAGKPRRKRLQARPHPQVLRTPGRQLRLQTKQI